MLLTSAVAESGMRCVLKRSRIGAQGGGKQESKIEGVSYNSDTQMTGGALGRGFAKPASSQSGDDGGGGLAWARQTSRPWLRWSVVDLSPMLDSEPRAWSWALPWSSAEPDTRGNLAGPATQRL